MKKKVKRALDVASAWAAFVASMGIAVLLALK